MRSSHMGNWIKIVEIRLRIASVRFLVRMIGTRWFQRIIFRPVIYATFACLLLRVLRDPDAFTDLGEGQLTAQAKALKVKLDAKVDRDPGVASREVALAMTWGTGGVAVVLLTTAVAIHVPSLSAQIGSGCFAISIPMFAICGVLQAHFSDLKAEAPTVGDSLRLTGLMYLAYLALCIGLAAFLWSYSPAVSVGFILTCYLALRFFNRTVARQFGRKMLK